MSLFTSTDLSLNAEITLEFKVMKSAFNSAKVAVLLLAALIRAMTFLEVIF